MAKNKQSTFNRLRDDAWLDELVIWADEQKIHEDQLPRDKQKIFFLTKLDLSGCRLTQLPENIGKLIHLTRLNVSSNQLTELPKTIGKLKN